MGFVATGAILFVTAVSGVGLFLLMKEEGQNKYLKWVNKF